MTRETVKERGCHLGVARHTGPIAKGQVGRDDDRGSLIEPADQGGRAAGTVQIGTICPTVSAAIHNNSMFNDTRLPCYAAKTRRTEIGCGRIRMTSRRSPLTVRSSSVTRQRQTISLTCSFIAHTPSQRQVTTWSVRSGGVRGWLG